MKSDCSSDSNTNWLAFSPNSLLRLGTVALLCVWIGALMIGKADGVPGWLAAVPFLLLLTLDLQGSKGAGDSRAGFRPWIGALLFHGIAIASVLASHSGVLRAHCGGGGAGCCGTASGGGCGSGCGAGQAAAGGCGCGAKTAAVPTKQAGGCGCGSASAAGAAKPAAGGGCGCGSASRAQQVTPAPSGATALQPQLHGAAQNGTTPLRAQLPGGATPLQPQLQGAAQNGATPLRAQLPGGATALQPQLQRVPPNRALNTVTGTRSLPPGQRTVASDVKAGANGAKALPIPPGLESSVEKPPAKPGPVTDAAKPSPEASPKTDGAAPPAPASQPAAPPQAPPPLPQPATSAADPKK
jgi:hypothetical protein